MVNPSAPPFARKLQPSAMNAISATTSMIKMIQSMPRFRWMPRMFTNVLNAMNTMPHSHAGLLGMSAVPQFITMTMSRPGTRI